MQRLKHGLGWVRELRYGQDTDPRTQRLLGILGLLAVVIVVIVSAVIYVFPFGKTTYAAMLSDGGSVRAGDDVRIAGISVGAVESVELTEDSVRMEFTVRDDVFLGDLTTLDIRMLTPIGGHYVAVSPSGTEPLGDQPIPADRVRLPYNLVEALQDAQRPIAEIDAGSLQRSLAQLTSSLQTSPNSVSSLTDAVSTMVGLLDKQNADVSRALDVAEEYLRVLGDTKSVIGSMLSKIGLMETQILDRKTEVIEALRVANEFLARIAAIEPAWREQLEPLADRIVAAVPQLDELGRRLGTVADLLVRAGDRFRSLVTPAGIAIDHSETTVRPICIPVQGRSC
ncbi:MCE family protein [Antrihabitans sp. YC3-6]|uniref:MCE family protein n=1 Tax=Antrihabitans stalagmiti TaxID=2799499 RepID=A0A934U5Y5_9NOCA|nr:MlaD family protein [Antrihabitans stalagmiti]MBJ8342015.1 MCE family protein [Antrihabitans stalagmiti]